MYTETQLECENFVRRYWDEKSDLPKHEKLGKAIAHSIIDGFWRPGTKLPTETEFVEVTPCGLGTVQRALRKLVDDGFIKRKRGSGSIVADVKAPLNEPWHMRFLSENSSDNSPDYLPIYTRILDRQVIKETGPWSKILGQNNQNIVKIDRFFTIGDKFFDVFSIFYTLEERFPKLATLPLGSLSGTNLKNFLAQKYQIPTHRIRNKIRFDSPHKDAIIKYNWNVTTTVTILNAIAFCLEGEPIYYQDFYIPPTEYTLDVGISVRK